MSKLPILGVAAAALVFGISVPAQAATSAQITLSNGTLTNVACPVTLQLSGFVTGPPNVPFEYWFENTRNGVRETTGKVGALMPPTGVAPIGGSITIGESTDAAKENHVQVQAASMGQRSPALSNVAAFTVTCRSRYLTRSGAVTADSRPAPRASRGPVSADPVIVPQPMPPPQRSATRVQPAAPLSAVKWQPTPTPVVPAPTGLQSTLDPQVCGAHAGLAGFICLATIPAGYLTLVWDWSPSAQFAQIDGYKIYRVDSGQRTVVGTQSAGITLNAFQQPAAGFPGQCFAVSAYNGASESTLSSPFCPTGGSTTQTISLPATPQRNSEEEHGYQTGMFVAFHDRLRSEGEAKPSGFQVGFASATSHGGLLGSDSSVNIAWRYALLFDTAGLTGRTIYHASLKLHVSKSLVFRPDETTWARFYAPAANADPRDVLVSCATNVGIPGEAWWQTQTWLTADFGTGVAPGRIRGPEVSIDVTKIVADWAAGRIDNYGLVLKGESEEMNAFKDDSCLTRFANPVLEVAYY